MTSDPPTPITSRRPTARYRENQPDLVTDATRALAELFGPAASPYVVDDGARVHVSITLDAAAVALLVELSKENRK